MCDHPAASLRPVRKQPGVKKSGVAFCKECGDEVVCSHPITVEGGMSVICRCCGECFVGTAVSVPVPLGMLPTPVVTR